MRICILLLCSILSFIGAHAQAPALVKGTVTSQTGSPVSASISVKGTRAGTSSDAQGRFQLNVSPSATLVVTSVGYQTQEVEVSGRSEIEITLVRDAQTLDEVIAVAYGTATRGTYTGSAAVINESEIRDLPNTSFQNSLMGRAPGVSVTAGSGQVGSTPSIQIRGIGSMSASTQPIYVVDGVVVSSGGTGQLGDVLYASNNVMNTINPSDIESISILKDAAAASLYGSRAANGVVLITTKKGKVGRPKVTVRSSIGLSPSWATDNYEAASTQENVNYLYMVFHDYNTSAGKTDAVANADALRRLNLKFNMHGYFFETDGTGLLENVHIRGMTDGIENREGKYFDWEDAYFRTGIFQTNDVALSGGTDMTRYYASLSYTQDKGRIKVNEYDRITGRVNLTQKIGKLFDFESLMTVANTNLSGYNDTRNLGSNYYEQTRNLMWGLYWPTNYKTGDPWTARLGSLAQNNVYYDNEWDNSSKTLRLSANESLTLNLLPELKLKTIFSYDNVQTRDHIYYSRKHFSGQNLGLVDEMTTTDTRLVSSNTANFDKLFANKHRVGLLAGFEAEKRNTDYVRASGKDLPSSSLPTVATAGERDATAYYWGNSMLSVFSRAEYNFDQKYFLSASVRRDGSSTLHPDTRWGNFWSVAGAWKMDREDFMQGMDAISNLRLRASYGVNGTLPLSNYAWRAMTGYGLKYMENAGGGLSNAPDPNLRWEMNHVANVALEFGLFNQRLYGTIEYFNRDSRDLLQNVEISRVTGFAQTLKNVGSFNNKGVELQIGGDIVRNNQIVWSAGVNGAFIKSTVTKLNEGAERIWYDNADSRSKLIYREGESPLSFYGYEYAGVDPENGLSRYFVNDPEDKTKGDFQIDGRGATYDFRKASDVIIGNGVPKVAGGGFTSVEYKGISLDLNFIYKLGGKLYDGAEKDVDDDGYYWERIRSKFAYDNMWTENNKNGTGPKISGNDLIDAIQYSSRHIYDASFLRLKSITLAYNLPSSITNKVGITNTRVYFNGSNLLTFSKYKNADPEVGRFATRGWETPFAKVYSFGIELSF